METEKPVVKVPVDGNAFAVMGAVTRALRRAGLYAEAGDYKSRAMAAGSYDGLLRVSMEYVDFDLSGEG